MSISSTYDEHLIVSKVSEGDESAFEILFYQFGPIIHPVILRLVKDNTVAEDIVSEVFLKLWLYRTRLPLVQNLAGYIYRLASNLSINHLRRNKLAESAITQLYFDLPGHANQVEQHISLRALRATLDRAIRQLPSQRRKIFELSRHEGYDRKAIAVQLGISEHTVKNQLRLALRQIQQIIFEEHGGIPVALLLFLEKFYS